MIRDSEQMAQINGVPLTLPFVAGGNGLVGRKNAQKAQKRRYYFCAFCAFLRLSRLGGLGGVL